MSAPRIYLSRPLQTGDVVAVTTQQARYLETVLRMREGDPLSVFNGTAWEYDAVLRRTDEGIALAIGAQRPVPAEGIEITLCQAIPKADKMEAIIRHATELGAGRIIPFFAERSVPRWSAAQSERKRERWQKIAIEAARQCGRTDIPEIADVAAYGDMIRAGQPVSLRLICWEEESAVGIREALRDPRHEGITSFLVVIGPEGGFDGDEVAQALAAGYLSVSLGKRVLRVDTAAAAVLAVLQYERGAIGAAGKGRAHGE